MKFTILLPPVTKKNSQRLIKTKNGRTIPLPSEAFEQYQKDASVFIPCKWKLINYPVNIKAVYYMPTKRRVDLTNLNSALHDVLVKYGVLKDDDCTIAYSTDGSYVVLGAEQPRTEIEITRREL